MRTATKVRVELSSVLGATTTDEFHAPASSYCEITGASTVPLTDGVEAMQSTQMLHELAPNDIETPGQQYKLAHGVSSRAIPRLELGGGFEQLNLAQTPVALPCRRNATQPTVSLFDDDCLPDDVLLAADLQELGAGDPPAARARVRVAY